MLHTVFRLCGLSFGRFWMREVEQWLDRKEPIDLCQKSNKLVRLMFWYALFQEYFHHVLGISFLFSQRFSDLSTSPSKTGAASRPTCWLQVFLADSRLVPRHGPLWKVGEPEKPEEMQGVGAKRSKRKAPGSNQGPIPSWWSRGTSWPLHTMINHPWRTCTVLSCHFSRKKSTNFAVVAICR